MDNFKFVAGKPVCPVACQYCFITEHDKRRERWNQKHLMDINKACTYLKGASQHKGKNK